MIFLIDVSNKHHYLSISFFLNYTRSPIFFLSRVVKPQLHQLIPTRLSWTVSHLLIVVDPLVGKKSLKYLWAALHHEANQLQQTSLLTSMERSAPSQQCPHTRVGKAPQVPGVCQSRTRQDCDRDALSERCFWSYIIFRVRGIDDKGKNRSKPNGVLSKSEK